MHAIFRLEKGSSSTRAASTLKDSRSLLWSSSDRAVTLAGEPEAVALARTWRLSLSPWCLYPPASGRLGARLRRAAPHGLPYVAWNTVTLMKTACGPRCWTLASLIIVEEREAAVLHGSCRAGRADGAGQARGADLGAGDDRVVLPQTWVSGTRGHRLHRDCHARTIFRVSYFGYPLPNTITRKVSVGGLPPQWRQHVSQSYILSGHPVCVALAIVISTFHVIRGHFKDHASLALAALRSRDCWFRSSAAAITSTDSALFNPPTPLLVLNLLHCARAIVPSYACGESSDSVSAALRLAGVAVLLGGSFRSESSSGCVVDHRAMLG